MTWFDNPIADMHGPYFLGLYLAVILGALAVAWWRLRFNDPTAGLELPPLPAEPDPYEIAYLRGGVREVASTALFELLQRGQVVFNGGKVRQPLKPPDRRDLSEPARRTRRAVGRLKGYPPRQIVSSHSLHRELHPYCDTELRKQLAPRKLIMTDEIRSFRLWVGVTTALVILVLGGYKLRVALEKGRSNVGFLIVLAIVAIIALAVMIHRTGPASTLGRRYLERMELAFGQFREPVTWKAVATPETLSTPAAADPRLLLAFGLFGEKVLENTAYKSYATEVASSAAAAASSDCVSSCSDGGGGCGGGCGGCGGGCG